MIELAERIAAAARHANQRLSEFDLDREMDFYAQGLDSLDHVQILMKVEEVFGVTFQDTDYDRCSSIASIASFLAAQRLDHGESGLGTDSGFDMPGGI